MVERIDTFDELKTLLTKAYWIEKKLEESAQWYGYLQRKSNHAKDILFQITQDADNHKSVLLELIHSISDFDLNASLQELHLDEPHYHFEQKNDKDIFLDVLGNVEMIDEIYKKLFALTDKQLINKYWTKGDVNHFYNTLSWLKNQENDHIELLEPFVLESLENLI